MRFLAFLLMFFIGAFLVTFVKAEECRTETRFLKVLDDSIKSKTADAAVAFKIVRDPQNYMVAAVIKKGQAYFTILSEFKGGCAVMLDATNDAAVLPFSPEQLPLLSSGTVIFEGGDIPSFLQFRS